VFDEIRAEKVSSLMKQMGVGLSHNFEFSAEFVESGLV
jgi:hypothetical protein